MTPGQRAFWVSFRGLFIAIGVIALLTVAASAPAHHNGTPHVTPSPTSTACVEDMPCWNCNTMGNYTCGPTAPTTTGGSP